MEVDPLGDNDDTVEAVPDAVGADAAAMGDNALGLVLIVVLVLLPNVLTIVLDDLHLFKLLLRCSFITSVMLFLFVDTEEENPEDAAGAADCSSSGFCCTGTGALEPLTAVVDFTVLVLVVLLVIALGFETEFVNVLLDGTGFVVTSLFVGGEIVFGLTVLVLLSADDVDTLLAFLSSILVLESTGL